MQSCKVMRQMPVQAGRAGMGFGEAGPETASDETASTLHEHPGTGSAKSKEGTGGLLEAALERLLRFHPSLAAGEMARRA